MLIWTRSIVHQVPCLGAGNDWVYTAGRENSHIHYNGPNKVGDLFDGLPEKSLLIDRTARDPDKRNDPSVWCDGPHSYMKMNYIAQQSINKFNDVLNCT
jgi:hypothetical protein